VQIVVPRFLLDSAVCMPCLIHHLMSLRWVFPPEQLQPQTVFSAMFDLQDTVIKRAFASYYQVTLWLLTRENN